MYEISAAGEASKYTHPEKCLTARHGAGGLSAPKSHIAIRSGCFTADEEVSARNLLAGIIFPLKTRTENRRSPATIFHRIEIAHLG